MSTQNPPDGDKPVEQLNVQSDTPGATTGPPTTRPKESPEPPIRLVDIHPGTSFRDAALAFYRGDLELQSTLEILRTVGGALLRKGAPHEA